jgi:hypothetical protein
MQQAVVDANVVYGAAVRKDQHHDEAMELMRAFDHGELPRAVVLSVVLTESMNGLHVDVGADTTEEMLNKIQESGGFEIRHVAEKDVSVGQRRFRLFDELSLTDAIITAWMDRNDVEYLYSFDDDFDVMDSITRLDTPHNPFS